MSDNTTTMSNVMAQANFHDAHSMGAETMRAACVAKVREIEADWRTQAAQQYSELAADKRDAAEYIATALESVVIEVE